MRKYACLFILFIFIPLVASRASEDLDELIHSSSKQKEALIVKVINTNMIVLENGERIKLIGVESFGLPEKPKVKYDEKGRPIEDQEIHPTISIEEQAFIFAQNLMEGKKVRLEYDIDARDEKGYKVAYVYLPDGRMANIELLLQGFVRFKLRPPNVKYEDALRKAYQEARKEQRGFLSY